MLLLQFAPGSLTPGRQRCDGPQDKDPLPQDKDLLPRRRICSLGQGSVAQDRDPTPGQGSTPRTRIHPQDMDPPPGHGFIPRTWIYPQDKDPPPGQRSAPPDKDPLQDPRDAAVPCPQPHGRMWAPPAPVIKLLPLSWLRGVLGCPGLCCSPTLQWGPPQPLPTPLLMSHR